MDKTAIIREWAETALQTLAPKSLNDRQLWMATAQAGEKYFNWRKVSYACNLFPDLRPKFEDLGVVVR